MNAVHHKIFQRLSDWNQGWHLNLEVAPDGVRIKQTVKYVFDHQEPIQTGGEPMQVHDMTVAGNGNLYLSDRLGNLWTYFPSAGVLECFLGGRNRQANVRLAVLDDALVVMEPQAAAPLIAYSIRNGQQLWQHTLWNGQSFTPLSAASDERQLYCLIRKTSGEELVLQIERSGRINGAFDFSERDDQEEPADPVSLHISENQIFRINYRTKTVQAMDRGEPSVQETFSLERLEGEMCAVCVDPLGYFYIGMAGNDRTEGQENGYVIRLNMNTGRSEMVPGFSGVTDKMVLDPEEQILVLNARKGSYAVLGPNARTRINPYTQQLNGYWFTNRIDSLTDDLQWHKSVMQASADRETQIRISYFCSNRTEFWIGDQHIELDAYINDPIPDPQTKLKTLRQFFGHTIETAADALFYQAKGRYMWLMIELIGNDRMTPRLEKLQIVFPRQTMVQYLPGIYQDESANRDFLDRYLSMFGTFFDRLEKQIDRFPQMYEVQSLQDEYVQWMASWMGLANEFEWDEETTRQLIRHAPELYRLRGTKATMEKWFEIITGKKPIIVEYMQYKEMSERADLKQLLDMLYGMDPYTFCVMVHPDDIRSDTMRMSLQHILEQEKPAFTSARLIVIEPWIYLDSHTFMDLNSFLSEPGLLRLDQKSAMPYSTVLTDEERKNRMDIHTRLDLDGKLE